MIRELLAVGFGGAAGSIARYLISYTMMTGYSLLGFPAGTFTVNALGSLLIGILLEATSSQTVGWLLIVGFCGGFTTFSAFSADAVRLLRADCYGAAAAYIGLSVAVCIIFTALGMWIGTVFKN
ncbi:fluoride efflux transporter CrcB [uncultured Alistipes sp.]|jgi:protein CrcB|uniref:fluoride efflux transporter CrcB n=1 Tax=uncultured Alistipes sp. TaxID=538949 RepID=UPI0025FE1553|nr:fluoride efflux transporter CrcB [uncultured Alistipes sp.]